MVGHDYAPALLAFSFFFFFLFAYIYFLFSFSVSFGSPSLFRVQLIPVLGA